MESESALVRVRALLTSRADDLAGIGATDKATYLRAVAVSLERPGDQKALNAMLSAWYPSGPTTEAWRLARCPDLPVRRERLADMLDFVDAFSADMRRRSSNEDLAKAAKKLSHRIDEGYRVRQAQAALAELLKLADDLDCRERVDNAIEADRAAFRRRNSLAAPSM